MPHQGCHVGAEAPELLRLRVSAMSIPPPGPPQESRRPWPRPRAAGRWASSWAAPPLQQPRQLRTLLLPPAQQQPQRFDQRLQRMVQHQPRIAPSRQVKHRRVGGQKQPFAPQLLQPAAVIQIAAAVQRQPAFALQRPMQQRQRPRRRQQIADPLPIPLALAPLGWPPGAGPMGLPPRGLTPLGGAPTCCRSRCSGPGW